MKRHAVKKPATFTAPANSSYFVTFTT